MPSTMPQTRTEFVNPLMAIEPRDLLNHSGKYLAVHVTSGIIASNDCYEDLVQFLDEEHPDCDYLVIPNEDISQMTQDRAPEPAADA